MDTSKKIIKGAVNGRGFTITSAITQWDYGWQFIPEIEDLPPTYRLDFSNEEKQGTALPVYCSTEGAEVPTELIDTGKDVWVWFVRIGDGFGITEYKWRVPNKCKPKTEQDEPTPSQQSSIDQAISTVNDAVERAEDAQQAIEDMSVSAQTLAEGSTATVTKTEQGGVVHLEFGIPRGQTGSKGDKGDKGDTGASGRDGVDGTDGYSPSATVTKVGDTATITITDKNGTTTAQISDGSGGGSATSPTASVAKVGDTATITITDINGTTTASISDGKDGTNGTNGTNGQDGYSPTASVSKSGGTATITITDKNGTTTATVNDGADGSNGTNGTNGADGTTFTPSVSTAGVISWTNDGGKQNPSAVDLVAAIPTATTQTAGKMSAQDKSHLDSVYADYSSALTALGVI